MKIFSINQKTGNKYKSGRFSDFFLSAPEKGKEIVLKQAALKSNKDQQKLVIESRLKIRTN